VAVCGAGSHAVSAERDAAGRTVRGMVTLNLRLGDKDGILLGILPIMEGYDGRRPSSLVLGATTFRVVGGDEGAGHETLYLTPICAAAD
jgi:hypothetical protein